MRRLCLAAAALALLALPATGFALYAWQVEAMASAAPVRADAIVVLTGEEDRAQLGFALLRAGLGERLLISGSVEGLNRHEKRRLRDLDPALFDARVDMDPGATDTAGNATSARDWAAAHGYRRLLVVSGAWHLPRGLWELRRTAPEREWLPVATDGKAAWDVELREYVRLWSRRALALVGAA